MEKLDRLLKENMNEIQAVLRVLESRRLKCPVSHVWMPEGRKAAFCFLNFRTWCTRYSISLSFLLEFLLEYYRRQRRLPGNAARLGLPASMITGPAARQALEEFLIRRFPNNENQRLARQRPLPLPLPVEKLPCEWEKGRTWEEYGRIMEKRQRAHAQQPTCRRNFRR